MGVFLCAAGLIFTEYVSLQKSKGEVLLFRRGFKKFSAQPEDEEAHNQHDQVTEEPTETVTKHTTNKSVTVETHAATFLWDNITYDVDIKGGKKRILDDVEGWVKPGTLTALMVK